MKGKYVKELVTYDTVNGEKYLVSRQGSQHAIATCYGNANASKVVRALNSMDKPKGKKQFWKGGRP